MKRHTKSFAVAMASLLLSTSPVLASNQKFSINVNQNPVTLNQEVGYPYIQNDRTFVPIRVVGENLGYKVDWNQQKRVVTIKGSKTIQLPVGQSTALVNGKKVAIDPRGNVQTTIRGSRTYVPLRFVSENMGAKVDYKRQAGRHIINITQGNNQVARSKDDPEGYLRPGETKEQVLARAKASYTETNAPGKVSAKWIDPQLKTVYIDPFSNEVGSDAPWGFVLKNADAFKGKDPNKYYMDIQIVDNRFVPWQDHFEMKAPDGTWGPAVGPIHNTSHIPLDNGGRRTATFDFFDMGKYSGTVLRTKGYNRIVSPYLGDVIDYKVTIHQDDEVHAYTFKVVYGRVLTDKTLNSSLVRPEAKDHVKMMFEGMNFYSKIPEANIQRFPLNWTQVQ